MNSTKEVKITVETDNINIEAIVGDKSFTFYGWKNFNFLDEQELTFDQAKDLIKQMQQAMKLAEAEEKKL